jgi:hypothetical protein
MADGGFGDSTLFNPKSDNSAEGGCLLPGVVPEIRNPKSE